MKEKKEVSKQITNLNRQIKIKSHDLYPGYIKYNKEEDIYSKYKEEKNVDPEDITQEKKANTDINLESKNELDSNQSCNDLDIPGSELDDEMEAIGCEDEENNYYSLGSDDHNDLEDNQG